MATPLPSCLALQPRRAHVLPVEDAWLIAQHWHDRLLYNVALERSRDDLSVKESYSSISFKLDLEQSEQASLARAAAVTWFALSCCPGYGGRENPVFWKCLFSELKHRESGSITDAYGFFDRDSDDFPRFKINVSGDNESNLLLFCGHPDHEMEREDKVQLGVLMEFLEPWVSPERARRRPVVSFSGAYSNYLTKTCLCDAPTEWPLSRLIRNVNHSTSSAWLSPIFQVQELDFSLIILDPKTCTWFHDMLCTHEVETATFVSYGNISVNWVSRDALASMASAVLGLPQSGVRARTTVLRLHSHFSLMLAPFLSALPSTTSIKSVSVESRGENESLQRDTISWIAYALFHPDTPASPWTSLSIQDTDPSGWLALLQAMASGNNLAAMLEGRAPSSDGYYRARLAAGTVVYDRGPRSLLSLHFQRSAVVMSDGNLVVDVCDVASDNPKRWPRWIAVVVPAYGLGWTRSANVVTVDKRPAAVSFLTRLRLCSRSGSRSTSPSSVQQLLSTVGHRLVHLDLGSYATFSSSAEIAHTLRSCPAIESLAIDCSKIEWNRSDLASSLPQLRELELRIPYRADDKAFDLPPSLQVLRLCVQYPGRYNYYASMIKHILSQPSQLRVFHWEDGLSHARRPMLYTETRADTAQRLEELQLPSDGHVDSRLPPRCAAAFLSVLVQPGRSDALTRLDTDVVKAIVAFAGMRQTLLIVLEPEEDELPPNLRHHPWSRPVRRT